MELINGDANTQNMEIFRGYEHCFLLRIAGDYSLKTVFKSTDIPANTCLQPSARTPIASQFNPINVPQSISYKHISIMNVEISSKSYSSSEILVANVCFFITSELGRNTAYLQQHDHFFSGVSNYTKSGSYATQGVHYVHVNGTHCHQHATRVHTTSHLDIGGVNPPSEVQQRSQSVPCRSQPVQRFHVFTGPKGSWPCSGKPASLFSADCSLSPETV